MGCAEAIVKLLVFGANLVFALGGLALIIVGVLYKLDFSDYTKAIPDDYQGVELAPIFTIVIGSIIFVIAFFGCCGAIRESPCLLTTYAVILLIIFLAQVAIGVFAFLEIRDVDQLNQKIDGSITNLFNNYNNNNASKRFVDLLQQEFQCCGTKSPDYWSNGKPPSCFDNKNKSFDEGCTEKFQNFLQHSIRIIGIVVLALSALEIVGCVFSLCLGSSIKNRERRFRY